MGMMRLPRTQSGARNDRQKIKDIKEEEIVANLYFFCYNKIANYYFNKIVI